MLTWRCNSLYKSSNVIWQHINCTISPNTNPLQYRKIPNIILNQSKLWRKQEMSTIAMKLNGVSFKLLFKCWWRNQIQLPLDDSNSFNLTLRVENPLLLLIIRSRTMLEDTCCALSSRKQIIKQTVLTYVSR